MFARFLAAAALALPFAFASAPAQALLPGHIVGHLVCQGGGSVAEGIGSTRQMRCEYRPLRQPTLVVPLTGTAKRIGLDIGITGPHVMAWAVYALRAPVKDDLTGRYLGGSADVSVALGGGGNVLFGTVDRQIMLQPVSLQGQIGLNLGIGVAELTLSGRVPVPRRRH
jgi:hypothetical protein